MCPELIVPLEWVAKVFLGHKGTWLVWWLIESKRNGKNFIGVFPRAKFGDYFQTSCFFFGRKDEEKIGKFGEGIGFAN